MNWILKFKKDSSLEEARQIIDQIANNLVVKGTMDRIWKLSNWKSTRFIRVTTNKLAQDILVYTIETVNDLISEDIGQPNIVVNNVKRVDVLKINLKEVITKFDYYMAATHSKRKRL